MTSTAATYKSAGVDIDTANEFIQKIKPLVKKTERPEVLSSIGHYAGLFELKNYKNPVIVASTDGVGTKLKLALTCKNLKGLGQDLVAMSANDLLCVGGEPLFFLDYFATGKLDLKTAPIILEGIANACRAINCTLLGGETAEMPMLYRNGEFDLAGFIVGVVEKDAILDGAKIRPGDKIIGLASSGFHANGFSLVRKVIEKKKLSLKKKYAPLTKPLGEVLLEPTRLYVRQVMELRKTFTIHGVAHITGGGLLENLPRILPHRCRAVLNKKGWKRPPVFDLFQKWGNIAEEEMHRVFNCGIGLMLVVPANESAAILRSLRDMKQEASVIGTIEKKGEKKGEEKKKGKVIEIV
jgi:phosphoribosylformylglycinamidine cyclo-ligase